MREVARLTGHFCKTVRKMSRAVSSPRPTPRVRPSSLDSFKDYLRQRCQEHRLSAVRLHAEITAQGYGGAARTVRQFVQLLKRNQEVDRSLTVRFETPPGEQAQADWAQIGHFTLPDGSAVRVYDCVVGLGFSRCLFVEFARLMRQETSIRCQDAFSFFVGWPKRRPKRFLYDDMPGRRPARLGQSALRRLRALPRLRGQTPPALPSPDQGQGRAHGPLCA